VIPRNDRDPLKPEDLQALKRAGEILLQHGVTHVLVDQDKKAFTVRSFNHGWRNGSGDHLASAFWSHFEQELRSDGLPLEAMLIPPGFEHVAEPDLIAPGPETTDLNDTSHVIYIESHPSMKYPVKPSE
jgi:hypothetical protein